MQIREMERKQKKREEEPVMKKWIVEKWKSVYGRRKILWKKYQIALWIEVIFIGVAAVCSGSLYQIERTNQTAAAQNVMEGIQNEIYHMVSGGGTPDEVRTLVTERMEELEREERHNVYGAALQFYNQKGSVMKTTGDKNIAVVWSASAEEGIITEDFMLEDYFDSEDLEDFFYSYYKSEGADQPGRSCGIRQMTGYYQEDGSFRPLEITFYDRDDAAGVYILQNSRKMERMSGEELVYRLGDLEQGEISRPEQTETGYFSLSIYDQGDNNMYMQAYSRIQSVTPGEFAEGGFERNESQGNVSIWQRKAANSGQIGGYCCSICADIETMIRDAGNLRRMTALVWVIGQGFAVFLIGIYLYIRKKKDRLEEMHNTFMNAVAHEMKTPAAVLKNSAECLQAGIHPEKQEHYLEIIQQEADHMNELLNSMLTYTRVTDSVYQIQKEECSLEQLARKVSRHYVDTAAEKKISLIWDVNSPAVVSCDPKLMEMVLDNLISNAVKFCREGGVIRITLEERSIGIYNEGKEIPEEDIIHIWEPMYRGDKSREYEKGSSGMGLAISGAVLRLHKADYGVKNVRDGVEFYLRM